MFKLNGNSEEIIKMFKITKVQIKERAKQVVYVGREENYEINLNHVMKNFF